MGPHFWCNGDVRHQYSLLSALLHQSLSLALNDANPNLGSSHLVTLHQNNAVIRPATVENQSSHLSHISARITPPQSWLRKVQAQRRHLLIA